MKSIKLVIASILASFLLVLCLQGASAPPNIVVILVDDMGFSDIGCYGGEIQHAQPR